MSHLSRSLLLSIVLSSVTPAVHPQKTDPATEEKVVRYLKDHVKPREPVVVSELINNVFKTPEERQVLDKLFNTIFKIPLFVAQYYVATNEIPSLKDISRQFNLPVDGEAAVLLTILASDPRVPRFIKRDPTSGEITHVDVKAINKDRRFGQALERTMIGWEGKKVPAFTLELFDGKTLSARELEGKNYLVYFWFTGCPPCVKIAPHLVDLQRKFGPMNFTVLAVNADRFLELATTDEQRAAYVSKTGFTFPVGHLNKEMQQDYGNINVYPTLFMVDSNGVIRKHYVNYQSLEVLSNDVEKMLKAGETAVEQEA